MKKYQIIYADPPWEVLAGSPNLHIPHQKSRPLSYNTMSVEEIKSLPVSVIADKDAILFLWTINSHIEESYEVARAWGFNPVNLLVWCKEPKGRGLGGAFGLSTEYINFARRGSLPCRKRWHTTWFNAPRRNHSRKPDAITDIIEQMFDGNKLELFARYRRMGWDCWGNEVDSDIDLRR